jgi:ubiquinone/menaquinone biosynthesis C-methylase UbiE
MASSKVQDNPWKNSDVTEKYKSAEVVTRPMADAIVKRAALDKHEGEILAFDLGTGTGAQVAAFYDALPKEKWNSARILAGDISEPMLAFVKERGQQEGWTGLETGIVDGAVCFELFFFLLLSFRSSLAVV